MVVNNPLGIFFDDDNIKEYYYGIEADWRKISMKEVRICDIENLKNAKSSAKAGHNYDCSQMVMEKIPQTGIR